LFCNQARILDQQLDRGSEKTERRTEGEEKNRKTNAEVRENRDTLPLSIRDLRLLFKRQYACEFMLERQSLRQCAGMASENQASHPATAFKSARAFS
jgi:hypothetical protein